ncbi:MAG TPA: aldolase/citrate lyase family protein [bacterium]|nr:aldolase/citrate lyase family protein [bacterium]
MSQESRKNRVLEKLRNGEVVLCTNSTPVCSPKIAELIGLIGFDCLWIDMEHQDFSYDEVFNACLACRATGMEPLVRIRREGRHSCARGFEVGGTGIMVPHCMGAEDAREIVRNARFWPVGLRGLDGVEALAQYGLMDTRQYMEWSNRETFVMVQIEDREAVEEVDGIAAVDGIDILLVGPGDLGQSYGCPGQFNHPKIRVAIERVSEAAEKHGRYWGIPCSTPDNARAMIRLGARFINAGSLIGVVQKGFLDIYREYTPVCADKLGDSSS